MPKRNGGPSNRIKSRLSSRKTRKFQRHNRIRPRDNGQNYTIFHRVSIEQVVHETQIKALRHRIAFYHLQQAIDTDSITLGISIRSMNQNEMESYAGNMTSWTKLKEEPCR